MKPITLTLSFLSALLLGSLLTAAEEATVTTGKIEARMYVDVDGDGKFDPDKDKLPEKVEVLVLQDGKWVTIQLEATFDTERGMFVVDKVPEGRFRLMFDFGENVIRTTESFQVTAGEPVTMSLLLTQSETGQISESYQRDSSPANQGATAAGAGGDGKDTMGTDAPPADSVNPGAIQGEEVSNFTP